MTTLDDILALLPDNSAGDISASDMRTAFTDTFGELDLKAPKASPTFTGTVSGVSKSMVGLGSADNTSDANKPVSTAQQTALNLKADLASPTFTGTVSGITAAMVGAQPLDSDLTTIAALTATTDNFLQAKSSAWASRTPAQVATDLQGLVTVAESQVTNLVSDLAGKQPLDSDLTTLAGLTATTDNFLQAKSSAWASRTPAQVATDLATPLQTAGLAPKASPALTGTATAVNVTISGRQLNTPVALTPGSTVSVDASLGNSFTLTAAQSFTLANPTSAVNGQMLFFALRQDGTGGWVITLGNKFRFGTDITSITMATGANKTSYLGVRYNGTDDTFDVLAFTTGF